jgi:hypothetical protein
MSLDKDIIIRKMSPAEADATQSLIATYADYLYGGVSSTAISQGMRGGFDARLFQKLNDTLDLLITLRRKSYPIPVDLRRVQECLKLIEKIRDGNPIVLEPLPVPKPVPVPDGLAVDDELVAAVCSGDYVPIMVKRGWDQPRLMHEISLNLERLKPQAKV